MVDLENEPDQEKRIEHLRKELEELGGEISHESNLPGDMEEEFLKHILAFETAEEMSLMEWLTNAGLEVPAPEELDDAELEEKLWQVINRMASLGAYLHHTNHLSNRELYSYLYRDGLREPTVLFPENPGFVYGIDLVGSGSEEDTELYMRYYADEDYRSQWVKDFPDYVLPPHEDPPYDRDEHLPKSPLG